MEAHQAQMATKREPSIADTKVSTMIGDTTALRCICGYDGCASGSLRSILKKRKSEKIVIRNRKQIKGTDYEQNRLGFKIILLLFLTHNKKANISDKLHYVSMGTVWLLYCVEKIKL